MDIATHITNKTYNVTLAGKFTFSDNPEFRGILEAVASSEVEHVIFHMSQLEFVDSAALGMLLLAHDEAEKYKKSISLHGVDGQVKRVFEMARLDQFFKF